MLIDLSNYFAFLVETILQNLGYHLSMREHKIGSPEHPLSDMGLIAYRSYWKSAIVSALRKRRNRHSVFIKGKFFKCLNIKSFFLIFINF